MALFDHKAMAGIFNYLVSWWNGQPFGQLDPILDKQISSELEIWKHLQSALASKAPNSEMLAIKDIQQLHLRDLVGTDAHIQKLRAQMFPKSRSSSSQFALVEDVLKDAIRKMVVSAEKEKINGGKAAYALFKEALNIQGFPEERIVELFSPILNVEQFGDFSFYSYNFRSSLEISFFAEFLRDSATVGDEKLILSLFNSIPKGSQRVFFRRLFIEISRDGPLESVDRFLEMAKHLNQEDVKEWVNAPTDILVQYCMDSPYVSIDNIQKIIALGVDKDGSNIADLLVHNNRFLDYQGVDGLLSCLERLGDSSAKKWVTSWVNTPFGKECIELYGIRSLPIVNHFLWDFKERIRSDDDIDSFLRVYLEHHLSNLDHQFSDISRSVLRDISQTIKGNHKLKLSGELLTKIVNLITYSRKPGVSEKENEKTYSSLLVAIENCDDINDVENYFLIDRKIRAPETIDQFVSLPIEDQQWLLTGFILFRDRNGLQLVSELLKQTDKGANIAAPVLQSALTLLKKTQILHDPDADETHLLNLIFSLWISTEGGNHREIEHILGEAVLALSELDFVRLKSQYRSGIFEIFKALVNSGKADPSVLNAFVQALSLYSYDPSKIEDVEVLDFLIPLMKRGSTPHEMKFSLAKMLSTVKYEPALLSAWDVIKGPLWDRYAQFEEKDERKVVYGTYSHYSFLPLHLHENRGVIKRRILDLLAELNLEDKNLPELFKEFYERNPDKLRALSKFQSSLENMGNSGIRYFDPLYLPKGSFIFRGIRGGGRGRDGLLDLFERGVGDSELTKAHPGSWIASGQIFCALDKEYASNYPDELGAFIVIKGDYVNQAIQKRRARQAREDGSAHYILYDTIGHQNIEKIYISKPLFSELQKLRNADPNNINPSDFSIFNYLSKEELGRFVRALKNDPHQIFEKLEATDSFPKNLGTTKEPETSFEQVISYNAEKEAARQLMEEKYASHFVPPTKSRL